MPSKKAISEVMRAFGRRGGRARANALNAKRRKAIAALGGKAKAEKARAVKKLLDRQARRADTTCAGGNRPTA